MLLLCQIFMMSSAYSVQYPNGKHPMGSSVSHHHSHENVHATFAHVHDIEAQPAFNATELIADLNGTDVVFASDNSEHDHNNHSHTPSHPPFESTFNSDFYQAGTVNDNDVLYNNYRYAPPNPPPHANYLSF